MSDERPNRPRPAGAPARSPVVPFDPTPPRPPPATADEAVRAAATDLAETHDVSPDAAEAAVRRLVDALAPAELRYDPPRLAAALARPPLDLLAEALAVLPADRAVRLVAEADLPDLARRVAAAAGLLAPDAPLYAVPELAARLAAFLDFQAGHRDLLVGTGLPPEPFARSRWLYHKLGRLYPTRETRSAVPYRERFPGGRADARPYEWVQTPGDTDLRGTDFRASDYHRADVYTGMPPAAALRVEADRGRLFDLRARVLGRTLAALRGQGGDLWADVLALLAADLTAADADFYLGLDRFYLRRDVTGPAAADGPDRTPGGLTDWLEVAGHAGQELTVGTLAAARAALPDVAMAGLRALLADRPAEAAYLVALGRPEQRALDAAVDALAAREGAVRSFWQAFRARAADDFRTAFRVELTVPVRPAAAALLRPVLRSYAGHVEDRLAEGRWFDAPPPGLCLFRRDGRTWTIAFEGRLGALPDMVGLFYLRLLLERPGRPVSASALRAARTLFEAAPGTPLAGLLDRAGADGPEAAADDLGEVADPDALRAYEEEAGRLDAARRTAEEADDAAAAERYRRELRALNRHQRSARGLGGRPRRMSPSEKQARDAVVKAINDAIAALAGAVPDLHRHLGQFLTRGQVCLYSPPHPIPWQF